MPYTKWTKEFTYASWGIENEFNASHCAFSGRDAVRKTREALEAAGIKWMSVVHDGSSNVDVEIVTPPFVDCPEFWEDYSKVMQVCKDLGLRYVDGCGLHLHTGIYRTKVGLNASEFWAKTKANAERGLSFERIRDEVCQRGDNEAMSFDLIHDIVRFYAQNQTKIDAAMPQSRAAQDGRSMITSISRLLLYPEFESAQDISALGGVMRRGLDGWAVSAKYNAVNILTVEEKETIEFRQHPATLSTPKIRNWLRLMQSIVDTCDTKRLPVMRAETQQTEVTATETVTTPVAPYRRGSNMDIIWRACRFEGGAPVRQLMALTGWDADTIRPRISEMRQAHGHDAVITHTQQSYNHRYGESNGRYDLGGYEVREEYERTVTQTVSTPVDTVPEAVPECIFDNVPSALAGYFQQGSVTRIRIS